MLLPLQSAADREVALTVLRLAHSLRLAHRHHLEALAEARSGCGGPEGRAGRRAALAEAACGFVTRRGLRDGVRALNRPDLDAFFGWALADRRFSLPPKGAVKLRTAAAAANTAAATTMGSSGGFDYPSGESREKEPGEENDSLLTHGPDVLGPKALQRALRDFAAENRRPAPAPRFMGEELEQGEAAAGGSVGAAARVAEVTAGLVDAAALVKWCACVNEALQRRYGYRRTDLAKLLKRFASDPRPPQAASAAPGGGGAGGAGNALAGFATDAGEGEYAARSAVGAGDAISAGALSAALASELKIGPSALPRGGLRALWALLGAGDPTRAPPTGPGAPLVSLFEVSCVLRHGHAEALRRERGREAAVRLQREARDAALDAAGRAKRHAYAVAAAAADGGRTALSARRHVGANLRTPGGHHNGNGKAAGGGGSGGGSLGASTSGGGGGGGPLSSEALVDQLLRETGSALLPQPPLARAEPGSPRSPAGGSRVGVGGGGYCGDRGNRARPGGCQEPTILVHEVNTAGVYGAFELSLRSNAAALDAINARSFARLRANALQEAAAGAAGGTRPARSFREDLA